MFTAARRVVRDARSDNEAHGGLLSRETMRSVEILARWVEKENHRLKIEAEPKVDVVWQGLRWACRETEIVDKAMQRGAAAGDDIVVLRPGATEVEHYRLAFAPV